MFQAFRRSAASGLRLTRSSRKAAARSGKRFCSDEGSALVEFAFVVPVFLIIALGMMSAGLLFHDYLELTEATNIGGEQLALARGTMADPCKTVGAAVINAAPLLSSANMSFTFNINGSSYSAAKGVSPTCTSLSSSATTGGYPVTLTVSYSCAGIIGVNFGYLGNFNPLPASACSLQSQIVEISQ